MNQFILAACFDTCRTAYLEAKELELSRPESVFMFYYLGCHSYVDKNAKQTAGKRGFLTSSSYLSKKSS